jgi:ribosomal protein L37E
MQKTKSLDSTVDYEKICNKCGNKGVIYRKDMCHCCYFGFEKKEETMR